MSRAGDGVLARIVARTREHVAARSRERPLASLLCDDGAQQGGRSLAAAASRPGSVNVIAEFKRRSPSRGLLRDDLHPVQVAQSYEVAGAAGLSVLTEEQFFGGHIEDLREARAATLLPTLRKDFIIDPYQIWEAWHAGADAVLLIVAALEDDALALLLREAGRAKLEALVEVHDAADLHRALRAGARLVGVNNRDLRTMEVSLRTSLDLAPLIPDDVVAVSESGLKTGADLRSLRSAGFDAFLIGEHFMLSEEPGAALARLLREAEGDGPRRSARTLVKVCGITTVEDGLAAARAGADAVGFVFWPRSPRAVTLESARRIAEALPPFVQRVGVFVDASAEEMESLADAVGLDVLQLHGDEPPERARSLRSRVIKAFRVDAAFAPARLDAWAGLASGVLLDASAPDGQRGGTGQTFDWSRATAARARTPFLMIAGGLRPENVGDAIASGRPDAVDVSSGVEAAPGRKDPARIAAFVDAVRRADARPGR